MKLFRANVCQLDLSRFLPTGNYPHHDVPVSDNTHYLVLLHNNDITNIPVSHQLSGVNRRPIRW